MSNTALAHAQFTNSFAQNLGANPTIVYARKTLSIPSVTTNQDPNSPAVWIVLDVPFVITGPNLVIDFDLGSAVGATSGTHNGDLNTLSTAGLHLISDASCGGTLTASSPAGSYNLSLGGATPNAPVWMMLSTEPSMSGGVPECS